MIQFLHPHSLPQGRTTTYLHVCAKYFSQRKDIFAFVGPLSAISLYTMVMCTHQIQMFHRQSTPQYHCVQPQPKIPWHRPRQFYLNTTLAQPKSTRVLIKSIPDEIIEYYNLRPLIHKEFVLEKINKGVYSLPQAGCIPYVKLKIHLKKVDMFPPG